MDMDRPLSSHFISLCIISRICLRFVPKWSELLSSKCSLPYECVLFFTAENGWIFSFLVWRIHSGFYSFRFSMLRNGFFVHQHFIVRLMVNRSAFEEQIRIEFKLLNTWTRWRKGDRESIYVGNSLSPSKRIAQWIWPNRFVWLSLCTFKKIRVRLLLSIEFTLCSLLTHTQSFTHACLFMFQSFFFSH